MWQRRYLHLVSATMDRSTEGVGGGGWGGSFRDVYIMQQQQQQQNEGDIASDPAHYLYGDKHDLFFYF